MARIRRTVALCTCFAIASCAGKRISDIDAPAPASASSPARDATAWSIPPGVVIPSGASGRPEIAGLYPSTVPNDRRCCWLAPRASVTVRPPAATKRYHIDVLVPDYPFFEAESQTLEIAIGRRAETFSDLGPGVHRLRFDASANDTTLATGLVRIAFRSRRAFVPATQHVNADTRSLGIILLGISFE